MPVAARAAIPDGQKRVVCWLLKNVVSLVTDNEKNKKHT
jgi:hypothetical protein